MSGTSYSTIKNKTRRALAQAAVGGPGKVMEDSALLKEFLARQEVFTTGQIAVLCGVAPRTVAKWFDSGRLKGYRIPGSQDRRVPRESLVAFLTAYGMPLGPLALSLKLTAYLFGVGDGPLRSKLEEAGLEVTCFGSLFDLAVAMTERFPSSVILDTSVLGRDETVQLVRKIRLTEEVRTKTVKSFGKPVRACVLVVLVGDDDLDHQKYLDAGATLVKQQIAEPNQLQTDTIFAINTSENL